MDLTGAIKVVVDGEGREERLEAVVEAAEAVIAAIAIAAGAWWTVVSPVLMTFLLLRVSGVVLLEKDIAERRPAYRDYVRRTSAFIPLPPRGRQAAGADGRN